MLKTLSIQPVFVGYLSSIFCRIDAISDKQSSEGSVASEVNSEGMGEKFNIFRFFELVNSLLMSNPRDV